MLRVLWFLVVLGLLAVGAIWLAERPGTVTLVWMGYRADTSFALLLGAVVLIAVMAAFLYRLWLFFRRAPAALGRVRRENRRRRGYLALTRGMVAVAAGDAEGAGKQVKKADVLLGDPALTMLLSAQAAQLAGDEAAAANFFRQMLDRPETEFLGVRGLLTQAMKGDDREEALLQAKAAHRLRPESEWVTRNLFDLQVAAGHWSDARETLGKAVRNKMSLGDEARHRGAVLDYLQSIEFLANGDQTRALKLARKAHQQEPGFVPAAVHLGRMLNEAGKPRKAEAVIESAWRVAPHPDLVEPYVTARKARDPLKKAAAVERLASFNPDNDESHLVMAAAALEASLWGEARKHLQPALDRERQSARVCRMMAQLEESEHGDTEAARQWLLRATYGDADPAWVCGRCGHAAGQWPAICWHCGEFDSSQWRTPPGVVILSAGGQEGPAMLTDAGNAGGIHAPRLSSDPFHTGEETG